MRVLQDVTLLSMPSKRDLPSSCSSVRQSSRIPYSPISVGLTVPMLPDYIPMPRSLPPPVLFDASSPLRTRPGYCDLCLRDAGRDSAWIRLNEERLNRTQRRIDSMLEVDDFEESQFLFPPSEDSIKSCLIDDRSMRRSSSAHQPVLPLDRLGEFHRAMLLVLFSNGSSLQKPFVVLISLSLTMSIGRYPIFLVH